METTCETRRDCARVTKLKLCVCISAWRISRTRACVLDLVHSASGMNGAHETQLAVRATSLAYAHDETGLSM
eukprot:6177023-Pleurochrysis_carterae.AAC.4